MIVNQHLETIIKQGWTGWVGDMETPQHGNASKKRKTLILPLI